MCSFIDAPCVPTKIYSELEMHAMRMGPGKHLKGMKLMDGLVKPEEVRVHE